MNELCGWFDTSALHVDEVLRRSASSMASALQSDYPAEIVTFKFGALVTRGPGSSIFVDSRHKMAAVICGKLEWDDAELIRCGRDHGNARALVVAYRRHGMALTRWLRGSWTFALFDPDAQRTILAADRMGISPLAYTITKSGEVVFGSTATSVAGHPAVDTRISEHSLYRFLYFHVIPSPATIFERVRKLEPAQAVVIDRQTARSLIYWQPAPDTSEPKLSEEDIFTELRKQTSEAIARSRPDSSTGCFLSGGLDSSTVAGVANQLTDSPFRAYTVGFNHQGFDETEFAESSARHFGLEHIKYYVTPSNVAEAFEVLSTSYDEPFGNASAIPTYFCAKRAKEDGVSRLLAGDGGDELFGGNERYATQLLFEQYQRIPSFLRQNLLEPALNRLRFDRPALLRKAWRYVDQANIPLPDRLQTYNFLDTFPSTEVFDPAFLGRIDIEVPKREMRETYARSQQFDILTRLLLFDWKLTLADNDLRKVNRMCHAAGVDVDYPLLDETLVDFSLSIPSSLKLKRLKLRYAFKEAHRGFLPDKILRKEKHGFGLPIGDWLNTSDDLREAILPNIDLFRQRGILNERFIDDIRNRHEREHAGYYGNMLWLIAVLERWLATNVAARKPTPIGYANASSP